MTVSVFNKIVIFNFIYISHESIAFIPGQIIWHVFRDIIIGKVAHLTLVLAELNPNWFLSVTSKSKASSNWRRFNLFRNNLRGSTSRFKFSYYVSVIMQNDLNISSEIRVNYTSISFDRTRWKTRTRIDFCQIFFLKNTDQFQSQYAAYYAVSKEHVWQKTNRSLQKLRLIFEDNKP